MKCDICELEITGVYRLLNLSYKVEEAPPKKSPFRESMKTTGVSFMSGDVFLGSDYKELGIEAFIENAKVCSACQKNIDVFLEGLKSVFHPLQGSVIE